MFDKMVTPSDVGKLNRLVIPKQHAERYFPLDPSASEKGLLLSFEDRTGKQWQFRYSYWKSSQSYVMTKGWSRFVKEKRLDAGDTVSFYRGVGESVRDRCFVDWKRKPAIHDPSRLLLLQQQQLPRSVTFPAMPSSAWNYPMVSFSRSAGPWAGRLVLPTPPPAAAAAAAAAAATSYDLQQRYSYGYSNVASGSSAAGAQYLVFRSAAAATPPTAAQAPNSGDVTLGLPMVLDSVPVVHSPQQATARRVRLFGVNLDLQEPDRQHPYQRPSPLQLQQQQQQTFSSSSSSPSSTANEQQQQHSLDLDL